MKKVSLITVNYNQPEATCALLDSVRAQDYRNVEVIVVDNGSREDPAALFAAQYPEVRFLRSPENLGFAGGNNLALPLATGDFFFFINNDAELTEGCIERLLALFDIVPDLGIVSPLICYFPSTLHPPPSTIIQYAGMTPISPFTGRNRMIGNGEADRGQFAEPYPVAYAHGAAMLVPRRVLEDVGPMSEDFFLYYEELDWSARIREAGYAVWLEPRARVFHKESLTVRRMGPLKTFYLNRNRVLFMRRHSGGWRLAVFFVFLWLVAVPKNALVFALQGDWENLGAFLRGGINMKPLRGYLEGKHTR